MDIGRLYTRAVLTVDPSDSVRQAAVSMMERGVGSAVVLSEGKPAGIFTDREALRAVAQGRVGKTATVGEFVSGKLTTVTPATDLLDAARIMRDRGFRHLVVVDEAGTLSGVFSMRDLVVGLLEDRSALAGVLSREAGSLEGD